MIKNFNEFIKDFNEYYQVNYKNITLKDCDIPEVIYNLYDSDEFEVYYDLKLIEIF